MVSSEGGDADGEQTGTMGATVTFATPSPFPLIDTKPFPTLPLCSPPVTSRFSIATGPLAVSDLPADADTDADPRHPISSLLLHYTLHILPGPRRPSASSVLLLPRPRSLAVVLLARPTAPPAGRDFPPACLHAHCFHILDTGLYSPLDFAPVFSLSSSSSHFRLPLFTAHLACTTPTFVLHALHASPPNL
ncbi:hypothetical protein B0H13DRAFT_2325261 [Mycena leptocephala]|nr:hypothetical protein B0H13DRAFT_2325261 [Mycena leptocephala]